MIRTIKNTLTNTLFFSLLIASNLMLSQEIKNKQPNVVFIICDDLNDAIKGLGGHPQAITPNINKLMKMGVTFTNAQTNAPLFGPSRASLWSGLLPSTTGYYGYKQQENHWRNNNTLKNTVTLFEQLSKNGYNVFATGKIHHNGHEDLSIFDNADGTNGFKVNSNFGPYPWDGEEASNNGKNRGVLHPDMPKEMAGQSLWNSFGAVKDLSTSMNGKGTWLYSPNNGIFKVKNDTDRDLMPDERSAAYAKEIIEKNMINHSL